MNGEAQDSSQSGGMAERTTGFLKKLSTELGFLTNEDMASVGRNLVKIVEQEVTTNPFQALATAIGIGFGIGSLRGKDLKSGLIQFGKMAALRVLSHNGIKKPTAESSVTH